MIQQKPADDQSLYKRAKRAVQRGDESMKPVVDWYEGKRKPTREKYPTQYTLRERIACREGALDPTDLTKKYGYYYGFWNRLCRKEFSRVPEEKCKKMLARLDGEPYEKPPQDWEGYKKVQAFLNDLDEIKPWCRKHNFSPQKAYRLRRGGYKNVPDVVEEMLEVIEG